MAWKRTHSPSDAKRKKAKKGIKDMFDWVRERSSQIRKSKSPQFTPHELQNAVFNKHRTMFVNELDRTYEHAAAVGTYYSTNDVCTSKYTWLSFMPKSLLEQFRRVANCYFLVISLLQLGTNLSPTNEYSTIGPLLLVLFATMIKAGLEDRRRHHLDYELNHRFAEVLVSAANDSTGTFRKKNKVVNSPEDCRDGSLGDIFESVHWKSLRVGQVVRVQKDEAVPADLLLLFSSDSNNEAVCETSSLDGESDMKIRHCLAWDNIKPAKACDFGDSVRARIRCEEPHQSISTFEGLITISRLKSKSSSGQGKVPTYKPIWSQDRSMGAADDSDDLSISIENLLLRGTKLKNTKWVIGTVVAAGKDTKLMQNMKGAPSKFSRMDRMANRCVLAVFATLFVICSSHAANHLVGAAAVYKRQDTADAMLHVDPPSFASYCKSWITFLILYNNMVPISLYISLEVIKWYQARRIEEDTELHCRETGNHATVRTTDINENLGEIKYIFSDKTGTITKNQMLFRHCSIGGIVFDGKTMELRQNFRERKGDKEGTTDLQQTGSESPFFSNTAMQQSKPYSNRNGRQVSLDIRSHDQLFNFVHPTHDLSLREQAVGKLAIPFFRCILLCHTVSIAESDGTDEHACTYYGTSPDEVALLNAAAEFSCYYDGKDGSVVSLRVFGKREKYQILDTNEFDSTRKCMSVVAQRVFDDENVEVMDYERDIFVFMKGADNVMFHKALRTSELKQLGQHIQYFAEMALRTLLFGFKIISQDEYETWKEESDSSKKSMENREHKIQTSLKSLESSMYLVGASGVEDLLQENAKASIQTLREADINVWMLTGDKEATAVSIGHMCGLIEKQTRLIVIKGKNRNECLEEIAFARKRMKRNGLWTPGIAKKNYALVVNSSALEFLLSDPGAATRQTVIARPLTADGLNETSVGGLSENGGDSHTTPPKSRFETNLDKAERHQIANDNRGSTRRSITSTSSIVSSSEPASTEEIFIQLATQCSTVIACRLSPIQKAQVVSLIRESIGNPLTLAIGDGGNDVSMIQEADVGVGVYGHEGMQAVRAADFTLANFSHLPRLLLVHGRWNARRLGLVILFTFYKNFALISTLMWNSVRNTFSGQTLYESYLMAGWNVFYTFFPIFVLGIYDKDLSAGIVLACPFAYKTSMKENQLTISRLTKWTSAAALHASIVIGMFFMAENRSMSDADGKTDGIYTLGTAIYSCLIYVVTAKAALIMEPIYRWRSVQYLSLAGGIIAFFVYTGIYCNLYVLFPYFDVFRDMYGIFSRLVLNSTYWLICLLTTVLSILPDVVVVYFQKTYLPSSNDILREIDVGFDEEYIEERDYALNASISADRSMDLLGPTRSQRSGSFSARRRTLRDSSGSFHPNRANENWGVDLSDSHNEPSECMELTRLLTDCQRAIAQELGMPDPLLRDEEINNTSSFKRQPKTHPITLQFMGEEHQYLEQEYQYVFACRERPRVLLCLHLLLVFIPFYAVYEVFIEKQMDYLNVRISMFLLAVLCIRLVRTTAFIKHYHKIVTTCTAIAGFTLTVTISDTGKFATALFPVVAFVIIRVHFHYALLLAAGHAAFYFSLTSFAMAFKPGSPAANEQLFFCLYMIFTIIFSATASYSLQLTMRKEFLQSRSLGLEQKRSTEILNNMMPAHVVQRLHNGETSISDEEPDVTILFCDIANFNAALNKFDANEVVSILDRLYSLFDQLCIKHGVQKMETVGKTYMACAGLQGKMKGKMAAVRVAAMATDMLDIISSIGTSEGYSIQIRIGINSGPVLSGLVGTKKQQFSLFGDTVNTASRMQSTGIIGRCQLSRETYLKLSRHFIFDERKVEAKGKGWLTTYILDEPKSILAHMACAGRLDAVNRRTSTQSTPSFKPSSPVHGNLNEDSLRMLTAAGQSKLKVWSDFLNMRSVSRWVLGVGDAESTAEADENRTNVEIMAQIRRLILTFKDDDVEDEYRLKTSSARVAGSRKTILAIIYYFTFAIIRDITLSDTIFSSNTKTYGHVYEDTLLLVGSRGGFIVFAAVILLTFRKGISEAFIKYAPYMTTLNYFCCLLAANNPLYVFWRRAYEADLNPGPFYVLACLDFIAIMLVMSNGGSLQHRFVIMCNTVLLVTTTAINIHMMISSPLQPEKFNSNFQPSYPLILLFMAAIINFIATSSVESFHRRQYLLIKRTKQETETADHLIYHMLPAAVVARLKTGDAVCEHHRQVGILFSDIKGFTSMSSKADPTQVVSVLSSLFSAFDRLTETHGVFKLQTIGDAYVIVSGLPYVDISAAASKSLADISFSNYALSKSTAVRQPVLNYGANKAGEDVLKEIEADEIRTSSPTAKLAENARRVTLVRTMTQRSDIQSKESSAKQSSADSSSKPIEYTRNGRKGAANVLTGRSRLASRRTTIKDASRLQLRTHIRDLLLMARDMHREVAAITDPNTGEQLQMRIGIHIGNIIGGVIGTTTLRYDMWGHDVLTANEMESNGVPGKTLVSPQVALAVSGMKDIQCEFHREVEFTNAGKMNTYLVECSPDQED